MKNTLANFSPNGLFDSLGNNSGGMGTPSRISPYSKNYQFKGGHLPTYFLAFQYSDEFLMKYYFLNDVCYKGIYSLKRELWHCASQDPC